MTTESEQMVARLLRDTESAHGAYETETLGGVFDTNWAAWYASYLREHGLNDLLAGAEPLGVDGLARMLTDLAADHERERPPEAWPEFYARRLAAALV